MGKTAGYTVKTYRYYNAAEKSVDFDGLVQDLDVRYWILNFYKHSCIFNIFVSSECSRELGYCFAWLCPQPKRHGLDNCPVEIIVGSFQSKIPYKLNKTMPIQTRLICLCFFFSKRSYSHSLMLPIKVSALEIWTRMLLLFACSSKKATSYSSPRALPRIWDFTVRDTKSS